MTIYATAVTKEDILQELKWIDWVERRTTSFDTLKDAQEDSSKSGYDIYQINIEVNKLDK